MEELLETCKKLYDYLFDIRFREWPREGLGIGLNPEELDELIMDADRVISKNTKRLKKHHIVLDEELQSLVRRIAKRFNELDGKTD